MVQALKEIIELENFDEVSFKETLSAFECVYSEDSHDVVDFLINKAVDKEKKAETRTYLVLNDDCWTQGILKIDGYFSIALNVLYFSKDVDRNIIAEIFGDSGKQNCPAYLIGQLARSSDSEKGAGKIFLDLALSYIKHVNGVVGGKIVYLDCNPDKRSYYERNGFKFLQQKHKSNLIQMFRVM